MRKIGLIDSGIGGLTILHEIMLKNLAAEYFYISDEENVPYGNKSQGFMLTQMISMVEKLVLNDVGTIIIACNTATAETIDSLRSKFTHINFVGIEPYVNYLNKENVDKDTKAGLILTEATANSSRFKKLVEKYDTEARIKIFPLPKLALILEELKDKSFQDIKMDIDKELEFLKHSKLDMLILGCTHYPLISSYLEKEFDLKVIDPVTAVIDRVVGLSGIEGKSPGPIDWKFHYNPNNCNQWETKVLIELKCFAR